MGKKGQTNDFLSLSNKVNLLGLELNTIENQTISDSYIIEETTKAVIIAAFIFNVIPLVLFSNLF